MSKDLDLVQQKRFCPFDYMNEFEKFKEEFPSTEKFYRSATNLNVNGEEYGHVLHVWNKFEMKAMKYYHDFHLKYCVSFLAGVLFFTEKFRLKTYVMKVMDNVRVIVWAHQL